MNNEFAGFKGGSANKLQIHNVTKVETQVHVIGHNNYVLNVFVHTREQEDILCLELFLQKDELLRVQQLEDWFAAKVLEAAHANQS